MGAGQASLSSWSSGALLVVCLLGLPHSKVASEWSDCLHSDWSLKDRIFQQIKQNLYRLLGCSPGNHIVSLLPHSIDSIRHKSLLHFTEGGIGSASDWKDCQCHQKKTWNGWYRCHYLCKIRSATRVFVRRLALLCSAWAHHLSIFSAGSSAFFFIDL